MIRVYRVVSCRVLYHFILLFESIYVASIYKYGLYVLTTLLDEKIRKLTGIFRTNVLFLIRQHGQSNSSDPRVTRNFQITL